MKRFPVKLAMVACLLAISGAARADITLSLTRFSESAGGNVGGTSVYSMTDSTTPEDYKNSYNSSGASLSVGENATGIPSSPVNSLSIHLSSGTDTAVTNAKDSYASNDSSVVYDGTLAVSQTGSYDLTVLAQASATASRYTDDTSEAFVTLTDETTNQSIVYDNQFTSGPSGKTLTPTTVTLTAGHTYSFFLEAVGNSYVYSGDTGSDDDTASVTFNLRPAVATPEPTTLLPTGLAVVLDLGHACRRRRAAS